MQSQRKSTALKSVLVTREETEALLKLLESARGKRAFPDILERLEEDLLGLSEDWRTAHTARPAATDGPLIIRFPKRQEAV